MLQGNIIGIDTVLSPPTNAKARSPPLWDPTPAATAAANYTILPVRLHFLPARPIPCLLACTCCSSGHVQERMAQGVLTCRSSRTWLWLQ